MNYRGAASRKSTTYNIHTHVRAYEHETELLEILVPWTSRAEVALFVFMPYKCRQGLHAFLKRGELKETNRIIFILPQIAAISILVLRSQT